MDVEETGSHLRGERHAEGQGHLRSWRSCPPSPTIPACAWTPSTEDPACTPPGTAARGWMTGDGIPCCCKLCGGRPPGRPILPAPLPVPSPTGTTMHRRGPGCHGTIAFAPMGEGGFGYDPVFFVPDKAKTFAQLTPEEKAAISHRGKALRAFSEKLATYLRQITVVPKNTRRRTAMKKTGMLPQVRQQRICWSVRAGAVQYHFPWAFVQLRRFSGMSAVAAAIPRSGLRRTPWRRLRQRLIMTKT